MIELDKLCRVPVFADLPPERLQWLCDNLTGFTVKAGDVLLVEGEISSSLFILLDAEVTATRRAEGHRPSERFVAPEILGTPCVIASTPYPATLRAATDGRLARLPEAAFRDLITSCAPFNRVITGG